jgi:hypothetical protein
MSFGVGRWIHACFLHCICIADRIAEQLMSGPQLLETVFLTDQHRSDIVRCHLYVFVESDLTTASQITRTPSSFSSPHSRRNSAACTLKTKELKAARSNPALGYTTNINRGGRRAVRFRAVPSSILKDR